MPGDSGMFQSTFVYVYRCFFSHGYVELLSFCPSLCVISIVCQAGRQVPADDRIMVLSELFKVVLGVIIARMIYIMHFCMACVCFVDSEWHYFSQLLHFVYMSVFVFDLRYKNSSCTATGFCPEA